MVDTNFSALPTFDVLASHRWFEDYHYLIHFYPSAGKRVARGLGSLPSAVH